MTAGAGHWRAAEALAQAIRESLPQAELQCVDALSYAPRWFRNGYAWSYLLLVRHVEWIWKISYAILDSGWGYRLVQPLRRAWNDLITRRFVDWITTQRFDVILTTHFMPADVCSAAKQARRWTGQLVVVVTDLHPHRFWIAPQPDAIVVATPESARVLQQRGVAADRIHVAGIPIGRAFSLPRDRAILQQRFAPDSSRRTVLVTSGGTTVGQFERVVHGLLGLEPEMPGRIQLLVVCGEDALTAARLLQQASISPMPMRVFEFVDYMADLMTVSDVIIAKAGGLTVSEALACGAPLVFYHVIPGQETMNARYVVAHGAGVIATNPVDVARLVRELVADADRLASMRVAAQTLGRPAAAQDIIERVVTPLLRTLNA